jgi:hypothetical protein
MSQKFIEITTVAACPINCKPFCPQELLGTQYDGTHLLSVDTFKKALENIPKQHEIVFAGYGEPFVNPKCAEMILHAHQEGHEISVFSTLANLKYADWTRIRAIPFFNFCIHLPDVKRITRIPLSQDYYQVLNELTAKPYSNFMSMAEPLPEVARIVGSKFNYGESYHFHDNERAGNTELAKKRTHYGRIQCVKLTSPQYVMLPDATVTLCCQDYGLKHKLGNLLTSTVDELGRSEEMLRVLKSANSYSDNYSLCRGCLGATTTLGNLKERGARILRAIYLYKVAKFALTNVQRIFGSSTRQVT